MTDGGWALIGVAFLTGLFQVVNTLLTRQKLSTLKEQADRIEVKAADTHEQVRSSNGRTLAQVAEDTVHEVDELRGDVMELAIQFARHMGDDHSHVTVQRMRQDRRDRAETAQTVRELQEGDPRAERRRIRRREDEGNQFDD